jgi:hypothetical protein
MTVFVEKFDLKNCLTYSLALADTEGLALWPWSGLVGLRHNGVRDVDRNN